MRHRLPFGRWKGTPLIEIPDGDLETLVYVVADPSIRAAIERELSIRHPEGLAEGLE